MIHPRVDLVIPNHNDPTGRIRPGDVGVIMGPSRPAYQLPPADYDAWGVYIAKWSVPWPMLIKMEVIPNGEAVFIRMMTTQPQSNRNTGSGSTHLQVDVLVPSPKPDEHSDRWVRALLRWLVCHELDEWITIDGHRMFDPHRNGKMPTPENS